MYGTLSSINTTLDSNNLDKKIRGLSIFQAHLRGGGGVNRDKGAYLKGIAYLILKRQRYQFSIKNYSVVSKVEKLKNKKLGGDQAVKDQNQIHNSSW